MSYTLFFLAAIMGTVVWWLLKQTFNLKPWAANVSTAAVRSEGVRSPLTSYVMPSSKVALGVFLAVVTSLFALFISAYSLRMEYGDWRPMPEPTILWVNTFILILGSVFLQYAWNAAKRENIEAVKFGVTGGAAISTAFIVGQLMAWNQLTSSGYLVSSNPANGFFYMLTAVHALHIAGGLVALGRTIRRVWTTDDVARIRLGTELCAVYWHYLLAVWIILFGFMLNT